MNTEIKYSIGTFQSQRNLTKKFIKIKKFCVICLLIFEKNKKNYSDGTINLNESFE